MNKKLWFSFMILVVVLFGMVSPAFAYAAENAIPPITTDGVTVINEPTPPANSETTGAVPLTPDGNATMVNNASNQDGKEFFTIKTRDDKVFYMVVDRQRGTENVYFLNAVDASDLSSFVKENNGSLPQKEQVVNKDENIGTDNKEQNTQKQEEKGFKFNIGYLIIGLAVIAVPLIYFFMKKKRKNQVEENEELEYDEYNEYDPIKNEEEVEEREEIDENNEMNGIKEVGEQEFFDEDEEI